MTKSLQSCMNVMKSWNVIVLAARVAWSVSLIQSKGALFIATIIDKCAKKTYIGWDGMKSVNDIAVNR